MKRFVVVIPKEDGGIELYPMKEWLRNNPTHIPVGLDASNNTSHQLRGGLKKQGWLIQETATEVRLLFPGEWNSEQSLIGGEEIDSDETLEDEAISFGLEHQLRDFIANNLGLIEIQGKRLRLYSDKATGRNGIEFPTNVGFIDILAVDDIGSFYVFELKRARSPDHTIGQLARYMGWVKHNLGESRGVQGVIVAKTISESLRFSVSVIPNVSLFEYEVSFELKPVSWVSEAA